MSPFSLKMKIGWVTSGAASLELSLSPGTRAAVAGAKSNAMAFSPRAAANDDIDPTDKDFLLYSAVSEDDSPKEIISSGEVGLSTL